VRKDERPSGAAVPGRVPNCCWPQGLDRVPAMRRKREGKVGEVCCVSGYRLAVREALRLGAVLKRWRTVEIFQLLAAVKWSRHVGHH
jgi:hypothetical protein